MAHTLLLELFSEEMPARMQHDAAHSLLKSMQQLLHDKYSCDVNGTTQYTPRRIAVCISGLPSQLAATAEEVRGPRVEATRAAIEGFMRKYQIKDLNKLVQRDGFYYYHASADSGAAADALKGVIEEAIRLVVWPKSMRWGDYKVRWVRPLHSILCLLDEQVVPVAYGHISASNVTFGHRFLNAEKIVVKKADTYLQQLEDAQVICDPLKRKQLILTEIEALIQPMSLSLLQDNTLMDEIVGLVEYPVVLLGSIPEHFMQLPQEVLVTTLRNNQKYLLLCNADGSLAPYFIIVCNMLAKDGGEQIILGNQKVLNARLSDAKFFYEQDRHKTLEARVPALKNLLFHDKIGSVYDKVQRITKLAVELAQVIGADRAKVEKAALFSKADLVTSMVGEFPELQGVMGYYYAIAEGHDIEVAYAIKEHYKPSGPSDYIPTRLTSIAVALAEKIDTLEQMFAIGIKPTGSKDPYALRRAAIGIIRIILHNAISLSLTQFIKSHEVLQFLLERFKVICRDKGLVIANPEELEKALLSTNYDIYSVHRALEHE